MDRDIRMKMNEINTGDGAEGVFDYVIVGGGSAGCVLASRLSEDPDVSVCLLESGPKDTHPMIRVPAGVLGLLFNPAVAWQYRTQAGEGTNGRQIHAGQGRTLGGSSSINGMVYNRGQREDFDHWAELGNRGWSYAEILPYFKRSEHRLDSEPDEFHGADGPLPVSDTDWRTPFTEAFIEGVANLGLPRNPDYNGRSQAGVGYIQRVIERGFRVNASRAFLRPALKRRGLHVRTGVHVTEILFDGKRACGVRYAQSDDRARTLKVTARCEVILAAGALNSPKLLQLSGIGPQAVLEQLGVPVRVELKGVGQNLRDHYGTRTVVRIRNTKSVNELARWPYLGWEIAKWMSKKPSIIGLSSSVGYVFWKSDERMALPDLQFVLQPVSFKRGQFGVLDDFPGMSLGCWPHRPYSSGFVNAGSTDPFDEPFIQPRYLSDERDRQALIAGIRLTRKFLGTPEISPYIEDEALPGRAVDTDDELLAFARDCGTTIYHFNGSCRMGPPDDGMAVVSPALKVYGVEGLRVVDASVMPTTPSANTYAPTLMIAEKAADLIRADRRQIA